MKKARLILSASLLALTASTTIISCGKDEACNAGYEGKNCDVEQREELIGLYDAADVNVEDSQDAEDYSPRISKNANSVTVVNISNFGNVFTVNTQVVTANISKSGNTISFDILSQKPDNEFTVSGKGSYDISSKRLTITYALQNPAGAINNYTGTWTKK